MVDNQHKKISGYRDLTEAEIALINEVKDEGERLRALLLRVKGIAGVDQRAVAIAQTELQTAMMWLVRAIARPEGF
jgi:hypothetical protein